MKKFKLFVFAIVAVLCMTLSVNAKTVTNIDELRSCMTSNETLTCEVTSQLVMNGEDIEIVGEKELVITDLLVLKKGIRIRENDKLTINGNITVDDTRVLFYVYPGGELNINSGEIVSNYKAPSPANEATIVAILGNSEDNEIKTNIVVGEDAVLRNGSISVFDGNGAAYGLNIDIKGKMYVKKDENGYNLLYVSGNIIKTSGNVPKIYVRKSAILNNEGSAGIFNSGYSHIIIAGGQITGSTGIEMRAGKLDVLNGKIVGTAETFTYKSNGNGSSTKGVGVVAAQHTTALPLEINIGNGEITGSEAVAMVFPEAKPNKEVVSLDITGGTFNTNVEEFVTEEGYTVKEINNKYVVGKENSITIEDVVNGKVEASAGKAIIGETVTITAIPDEGYEVKSIKVAGTSNTEIPVTDNKFVMPNASVTVKVEFSKISTSTDIPVIDTKEEIKEVEIGVSDKTETEKILLESLDKDEKLKELAKDESVKVAVEIEKIEIAKEVETKIVEKVKEKYENIVVSEYFDITVAVKNVNNEELGTISKLSNNIKLMVALPESLKLNEEGKTRNYYIIRQHGEEIEIIDNVKLSEDGKTLVFETDRFSTYAIAYEDVNVVSPETGDSILTFVAFGSLALVSIVGAVLYIKKKEFNK